MKKSKENARIIKDRKITRYILKIISDFGNVIYLWIYVTLCGLLWKYSRTHIDIGPTDAVVPKSYTVYWDKYIAYKNTILN